MSDLNNISAAMGDNTTASGANPAGTGDNARRLSSLLLDIIPESNNNAASTGNNAPGTGAGDAATASNASLRDAVSARIAEASTRPVERPLEPQWVCLAKRLDIVIPPNAAIVSPKRNNCRPSCIGCHAFDAPNKAVHQCSKCSSTYCDLCRAKFLLYTNGLLNEHCSHCRGMVADILINMLARSNHDLRRQHKEDRRLLKQNRRSMKDMYEKLMQCLSSEDEDEDDDEEEESSRKRQRVA